MTELDIIETMPSRFGHQTHSEALLEAETRETWLVEGLISATSTLIYGEAKVGKSFLTSALIAALVSGEPFLDVPTPTDRDFRIAVCWTDDGGAADYASQVQGVIPEDTDAPIDYYVLPSMRPADWQALFEELTLNGTTLVVIDNLTQALDGSINQDDVVRSFFDGVRLFTRAGIPVVIIGHSSDKSMPNGATPDKPMGSSVISQSVRWRVFVRRSRKGNLTLKFSGNYAEPHEITLRHGAGARFEIVDTKSAEQVRADAETRSQQRDKGTLDLNKRIADWLVANGQGKGVNEAAVALAATGEFGSSSKETMRSKINATGAVGKMLNRTGTGASTRWTHKSA
ncbi:MAG: hypothetical protein ABS81_07225 [Pseudonocardia sp. SCN 72-86]|nr:MAG: hypothetical protein ABS81_07225 [Pseudonocardia sp. SCN 72-86]